MFTKILIANRGEVAVQIIRACQEMDIRTVAVYSEADANALHTMLADKSVCIGPPSPGQSYLCGDCILDVAKRLGCDTIHPGYGFLSENAAFAEAVGAQPVFFYRSKPGSHAHHGFQDLGPCRHGRRGRADCPRLSAKPGRCRPDCGR